MRTSLGALAVVVCVQSFACSSATRYSGRESIDVRKVLESAVRVDVIDGRFVSISIDSVPPAAEGAVLINRYRRIFVYLVEHQVAPTRLFRGVSTAKSNPDVVLIDNLVADPAATFVLAAYLASSAEGRFSRRSTQRPTIAEADVLAIAARFFHPVVIDGRFVGFYRCAGINGMADLGTARKPAVEAFAFWGLAPAVFDADSASTVARALNSDFSNAKTAFRTAVRNANYAPEVVARARNELYAAMGASAALRTILQDAYKRASSFVPFLVAGW